MSDYTYRDSTSVTGKTTEYNAVFTDKKKEGVESMDFLKLMIAQLQNQNFLEPVDDTQYMAQMAQFATMQKMTELAEYSKSNYVMSLFGKNVTVARFTVAGDVDKATGPIEKVSLVEGEYAITVGGKQYTLDQIMEIHNPESMPTTGFDTTKNVIIPIKNESNAIGVMWDKPGDVDGYKYTVYYSTSSAFDTVSQVESGKVFGDKDRVDLTEELITGLTPDTTYYVNVVVTNADGEKSVMTKTVVHTPKE